MLFTEMDFSLWGMALLVVMAFIAGFIDAIAGGGGMIQTLALLMVGVPPVTTLATNKLVSICGTSMAVVKYARAEAINWHLVVACLLPCLIAAGIGSKTVMFFSDTVISWMIVLCVPVALAVLFFKHTEYQDGQGESPSRGKAAALLTPIAFYDGLIGPGTGTYMAIAGNKGLHMRLLRATGLAKPLNLATNAGSAVVYISAGKVLWMLAIPMAGANIAGAWLGSHSAIHYGDSFIKKVMLVMLGVMLIVNLVKLVNW
ncbi:MAG: hypothetical protein CSA52_00875 [Gammaproteobacteria bacterium]|nr:MAG: hypothetical protein CSB48_08180 [Pseudomonadota bacterium]PIE38852.1 MAG: hypothetical protein CSA52_00875 [Gammaproteobacteria bacterium]